MAYHIRRDPNGAIYIHDGDRVVEKFARSEIDKAETRAKELEDQALGAAKQQHQAKYQDTKPVKRRRKVKAPNWVLEWVKDGWEPDGKEDGWRLGDPEGYKTAADTIAKIKAGVPAIERRYSFRDYYPIEEYGYEKPFDLADRLVGLLETYKRNKTQPPIKESLDEHERRLTEIKMTSSLANATVMEIACLAMEGYRLHRDPETGREKHDLQRAVRKLEVGPRKEGGAGGYLTPEAKLARGLASTYHTGTGKALKLSTGTRGNLLGPYARFAHECLALLNIAVTDATLRDQARWKRTHFEKREEERSNARSKPKG